MEITQAMMRAAREAEFAHHQRTGGGRFRPLPDALIRVIVDAAIDAIGMDDEPETPPKPKPSPMKSQCHRVQWQRRGS